MGCEGLEESKDSPQEVNEELKWLEWPEVAEDTASVLHDLPAQLVALLRVAQVLRWRLHVVRTSGRAYGEGTGICCASACGGHCQKAKVNARVVVPSRTS